MVTDGLEKGGSRVDFFLGLPPFIWSSFLLPPAWKSVDLWLSYLFILIPFVWVARFLFLALLWAGGFFFSCLASECLLFAPGELYYIIHYLNGGGGRDEARVVS
jgi:hypothetical protein